MRKNSLFISNRNLFLINFAFWLVMAGLAILKNYYYIMRSGEEIDWTERVIWMGADYFSLWVLSFVIYYLFQKTYTKAWRPFLWFHFPASIVFGVLNLTLSVVTVMVCLRQIRPYEMPFGEAFMINMSNFLGFSINGFLIYWLVLLVLFSLNFYARYRDQYIKSLELESKLNQSQLQTLKMQLHPHFLFNALNTIAMMVRNDKDRQAVDMLSGLSDLLRQSLSRETGQFVPFEKEVSLLERYLHIEEVRFKDRLQVKMEIDPATKEVSFPSLLLQPIVENAFKHGIAHSLDDAVLRLKSQKIEEELHVWVENTGQCLPTDWDLKTQKGIGLSNTISRLKQLYGEAHSFTINNLEPTGVSVHISIPVKRDEQEKALTA